MEKQRKVLGYGVLRNEIYKKSIVKNLFTVICFLTTVTLITVIVAVSGNEENCDPPLK